VADNSAAVQRTFNNCDARAPTVDEVDQGQDWRITGNFP
jgi:hypothetical protein